MSKIEINDRKTPADLDPTPSLRELAHALKHGTFTVTPNLHVQTGQPIVWVSLQDLTKIKKALRDKKEPSGAV